MKVQPISFPVYKNTPCINFAGMGRKYVQNDSFINAVPRNYKSNEIEDYLKSSKKELRNLEYAAKEHQRQCMYILRCAKRNSFSNIEADNYNITFGKINEETELPSSINVWEDGRLVQSYVINSVSPAVNIEVYNCKNKNYTEEYLIVNKSLVGYTAKKPQEKEIELIIPHKNGFYKTEGTYKGNIIKKSKEIEFFKSPDTESKYFEYREGVSSGYSYNSRKKCWKRNNEQKSGILKLTEK